MYLSGKRKTCVFVTVSSIERGVVSNPDSNVRLRNGKTQLEVGLNRAPARLDAEHEGAAQWEGGLHHRDFGTTSKNIITTGKLMYKTWERRVGRKISTVIRGKEERKSTRAE